MSRPGVWTWLTYSTPIQATLLCCVVCDLEALSRLLYCRTSENAYNTLNEEAACLLTPYSATLCNNSNLIIPKLDSCCDSILARVFPKWQSICKKDVIIRSTLQCRIQVIGTVIELYTNVHAKQ